MIKFKIMNALKNTLILCLVTLLTLTFGEVNAKSLKGNGNVVKQERDVENFIGVAAKTGLDVFVTIGQPFEVVVETDENLLEAVETKVRDGVLHVSIVKSIRNSTKLNVYVTMPAVRSLGVSSGADLTVDGVIRGDECKISASSGGDVTAEVDVKEIRCTASSGGDVNVEGKADFMKGSASSGGDVEAKALTVKVCNVSASSGGDLNVTVTEEITASASSAGDVTYYGKPQKFDTNSSSGGDVNRR
ncbi:DUF2807 domain-containing protein [Puteibacter caeruleilacunae]|nr:DUF2807 domain-containing protein [Puteibacter caeruleilacunae]